jgi:hypothetical protein
MRPLGIQGPASSLVHAVNGVAPSIMQDRKA